MPSRTVSGSHILLALFVILGLRCLSAQETPAPGASGPEAAASPAQIVEANTLESIGKRPFHLKMSFQLFALDGKSFEQGSLEYWWAGAEGTHLDITTPSLGTTHSGDLGDTSNAVAARSRYLIGELLTSVHSPGAVLGLPKSQVVVEDRMFGGVPFRCMHTVLPQAKYAGDPVQVCADAATGTIRVIGDREYEITRNRVARFADERTALDVTITWLARKAIVGHVDQLQSYQPNGSTVALERPAGADEDKPRDGERVRVAGGVLAGIKISGLQPVYPIGARERRISGSVILSAEISKEGKIEHLFPLASADLLFTEASINAVSGWLYKPYLLNGEPTSVSTVITIHFNLNSN